MDNPSLPMIVWKMIHTSLAPQQPIKERYTHTDKNTSTSLLDYYQQNFRNIIEFQGFAGNEYEASALEWWLVRQTYQYRDYISMAGAEHWHYLEARDDFMTVTGDVKWPSRPVRYEFDTAMVFPIVKHPLLSINIDITESPFPITKKEILVRGEDTISSTHLDIIVAVTSLDETIQYTPMFDGVTQKFSWLPDQDQPNQGVPYIAHYLQYGEETFSMPLP